MKENPIHALLRRPQVAIMGIVNVTPDSFSDGGQYLQADLACQQGVQLVSEGADILDIGGESTRPGAAFVSLQQELDRVIPVIEKLVQVTNTPISIDTYKADVMQAAISAGASMINDVNALQSPNALETVAQLQVPVCLMHMRGKPDNMQNEPTYEDVVKDVVDFLQQRIDACARSNIVNDNIIVDPGIGFGKTLQHNLSLLAAVDQFAKLGAGVLVGVSRKSMIDKLFGRTVDQRLSASLGLAVQSVINGAKILRVHDVQATHDAVRSAEAVIFSSV